MTTSLYLRIADRLRQRIASGEWPGGTRLPPQRSLAIAESVTLGTVSRAYGELLRDGLVEATVGRGTYVRHRPQRSGPREADLRATRPPTRDACRMVMEALKYAAEISDAGLGTDALTAFAEPRYRRAALGWLGIFGEVPSDDELLLCSGGQQALAVSLVSTCGTGDLVLTEVSTYSGLIVAARSLGLRLAGVLMDEQGMRPDALDAACAASRPRIVVVTPTFHSPTAVTMPIERRRDLARIAERHDCLILEDDVYGPLADGPLPSIRHFAPQRTISFTSFSKVFAPGLRAGILQAPSALVPTIFACIRSIAGGIDPLSWEALAWLQNSGDLAEAVRQNRKELLARYRLASALAGDRMIGQPGCPHAMLRLSDGISQDSVILSLREKGIRVLPGSMFDVEPAKARVNAVRFSLSSAGNHSELEQALQILLASTRWERNDTAPLA